MPRGLLIFAFCLPLAILMGFMLADPLMGRNMMVVGATLTALLIPLALSVHHTALIWVAAAYVNAYFLPGQPQMWMVFAAMSFGISVLSWPLAKKRVRPVWDRSIVGSLIFLAALIVVTAYESGGIGLRVLGSSTYGGRKFVWLMASIVGFFALTFAAIPRRKAQRDVSVYALAPVTAAVGNIAYMLGPLFYFLFLLFPVDMAVGQAQADLSPLMVGVKRLNGFGPASVGVVMFCYLRWGLRGILRVDKPWRVGLVAFGLFLGMLSGFRSAIAICFLVAVVQFFAEGLHRTRYAVGFAGLAIAGAIFLALFAESLPLAAQRAISFLPVKVDPTAALDARASLEWRFKLWRFVVRDIPKHFWIGKGYAIDPTDLYFVSESIKIGLPEEEAIAVTGDYHSGPLSLIVPLGIFGVIGFTWFCAASIRALWKNLKYGDAEIRNINIFLFSFFVGRLIFFLVFFGSFEGDLWLFTSIIGLSLSVNGGVREPPQKPRLRHEKRGVRTDELVAAPA